MENLQAFFEMGGYAFYVWSSYALALTGLGGLVILSRRSQTKAQAELDLLRPPKEKTTSQSNTEAPATHLPPEQGIDPREA
ncbi:MAG: heme exporter protein CcmD [Rhodospirillaceae bacterium]